MPIRRINYTKRRRILQKDVQFVIREQDGAPAFDASLNLSDYRFPADARVFVEAYRQTTVIRFDFGTVGVPTPPPHRYIAEFDTIDAVLFRVRVTAASDNRGIVLGEADQIKPHAPDEVPDQRIPLLPIRPDDLGEEVWRIEFSESAVHLLINKRVGNWKEIAANPHFKSLVYPAAMRSILEHVLRVEEVNTPDDPEDWRSRWIRFAMQLPGSSQIPIDRSEYTDWIDDAVSAFARKNTLMSSYIAQESEG